MKDYIEDKWGLDVNPTNIRLRQCVKEAWEAVLEEWLREHLASMPVRWVNGQHIEYCTRCVNISYTHNLLRPAGLTRRAPMNIIHTLLKIMSWSPEAHTIFFLLMSSPFFLSLQILVD